MSSSSFVSHIGSVHTRHRRETEKSQSRSVKGYHIIKAISFTVRHVHNSEEFHKSRTVV